MEDVTVKQPARREAPTVREDGRSLFPVSRVQKIIKADKDLPIVAKEAVFLISVAAEEFIKRISTASQRQAQREKRTTVQRKDLAVVVKRADEFFFLEDIISWEQEEQPGRSRKKAVGPSGGPLHFALAPPGKTVESIQAEEPSAVANTGESA